MRGVPVYQLSDGHSIPVMGFGTYRIKPGSDTYAAVSTALEAGYRMFDTAEIYMNEAQVGRAIRDSGIPRSEVFVSTKLWDAYHEFSAAVRAGTESNARLGLGYIDAMLIHSPSTGRIVEAYDALLRLQADGIVRSVGVSNFGVAHLRTLSEYCRPAPAVDQFELHPLIIDRRADLVEYCRAHGILVQAYGSILSGHEELLSLANSTAKAHNRTAAQVMLRWALDQGFQVIPKSEHRSFMVENLGALDFSLSAADIAQLNSINGSLHEYWDVIDTPPDPGNVGAKPASCPP